MVTSAKSKSIWLEDTLQEAEREQTGAAGSLGLRHPLQAWELDVASV